MPDLIGPVGWARLRGDNVSESPASGGDYPDHETGRRGVQFHPLGDAVGLALGYPIAAGQGPHGQAGGAIRPHQGVTFGAVQVLHVA